MTISKTAMPATDAHRAEPRVPAAEADVAGYSVPLNEVRMFGVLQTTASNVIRQLGEALSTMARKG